jgi:uncharacterized Tic20 family protein
MMARFQRAAALNTIHVIIIFIIAFFLPTVSCITSLPISSRLIINLAFHCPIITITCIIIIIIIVIVIVIVCLDGQRRGGSNPSQPGGVQTRAHRRSQL